MDIDSGDFQGRYTYNRTETLNVTDSNTKVGLYGGMFYKNETTVQPYTTITYLKAVWEPRRAFVLK